MSRSWWLSVMLFAVVRIDAAPISVQVLARDGRPVVGAVVELRGRASEGRSPTTPAVMDQVGQRFVPFVLPVHVGSAVTFPNSDSVAHQVYSFSPPKRFELGLYRGRPHAPVVFDKSGVVVLGCNIHDKMIGYIYVTDAPHFGQTNSQGAWIADVAPAEYRVAVWSPLFARDEPSLEGSLAASETGKRELVFRLTRPMQPEPAPQTDRKLRDY